MASSLYSQLPLNTSNSEIRTLTVHPSDDHEAPINCSLGVASLNDNCDFEALSYVWHEPSLADVAPVAILVNGCEFTPTPNLFSALQHLRLPQKSRRLWVDAICINQDDLDERSAQVPLMVRIYTSAQAVAVWLGPSNDDVDTYARLEPGMAADINFFEESFSCHYEGLSSPADPKIATEMEKRWLEMAPKLLPLLPGHSSLVRKSYWSRMWTYQECCLPSASRGFYCGYNLFTWAQVGSRLTSSYLFALNRFQDKLETYRSCCGGPRHLPQGWQDCGSSLALGMADQALDSPLPDGSSGLPSPRLHGLLVDFDTHLSNTKHRNCADPLDRFYALYGLVQNPSRIPIVDYTKDLHTVSAEVTSFLMLGHMGARLFDDWICGASGTLAVPSDNIWPSWVPDFRTTLPLPWLRHNNGVRASPRNKIISISQSPSTITIQGKSFGPSRVLARFKSTTVEDIELFALGLGQTLSSLAARPQLDSFLERIERLIKVLLFRDGKGMEAMTSPLRDAMLKLILNWYNKSLNRLDVANSSTDNIRPSLRLPKISEFDRGVWKYSIITEQPMAEVMFVTDDLHLGFCNAQMRDGDIVARLGNQKGSCVLRRCETESSGNPLEETVTMIGPSAVRYLPLIWDTETEDSDTWYEDMTVDETEPVVFTIR